MRELEVYHMIPEASLAFTSFSRAALVLQGDDTCAPPIVFWGGKGFDDMVNEGMDMLGRHIQNGGISVAKIDAFVALRSPTSFQELGKDLGTFT
jgi:hypothetical protein